jgi:hypothetical protein
MNHDVEPMTIVRGKVGNETHAFGPFAHRYRAEKLVMKLAMNGIYYHIWIDEYPDPDTSQT